MTIDLSKQLQELGLPTAGQPNTPPPVATEQSPEELWAAHDAALARGDIAEASRIAHVIRGGKVIKQMMKRGTGAMRSMWKKANRARKAYFKLYRRKAKKLLAKHRAKLSRFSKRNENVQTPINASKLALPKVESATASIDQLLAETVAIRAATSAASVRELVPGLADLALSFHAMSERFDLFAAGFAENEGNEDDDVDAEAIEDLGQFAATLGALAVRASDLAKATNEMTDAGRAVNTQLIEAAYKALFAECTEALELYSYITDDDSSPTEG